MHYIHIVYPVKYLMEETVHGSVHTGRQWYKATSTFANQPVPFNNNLTISIIVTDYFLYS